MCHLYHLVVIVLVLLYNSTATNILPSCITNTPCKCHLTNHSFTLINCSHTLLDLPTLNVRAQIFVTQLSARNALARWPSHICKYPNLNILDLSGSHFASHLLDLSCLSQLMHLNLSQCQLQIIPKLFFPKNNTFKHLHTIDLSNNLLHNIDFVNFRSFINFAFISFENNPIERIAHFENLLALPQLEFVDLTFSNSVTIIEQPLTMSDWIEIVHRWNSSTKSLIIQANTIAIQSILPSPDRFMSGEPGLLTNILKKMSNSTFTALLDTPKCNCTHLRHYQHLLSSINFENDSSLLFQSATCLMPNGIVHARLFDHHTIADLRCPILPKRLLTISIPSSSSSSIFAITQFLLILLSCLLLIY